MAIQGSACGGAALPKGRGNRDRRRAEGRGGAIITAAPTASDTIVPATTGVPVVSRGDVTLTTRALMTVMTG